MKIHILTLFPSFFEGPFSCGIVGRAREKGLVEIRTVNIRDFTSDPYRSVDDYPFGGGSGMVMKVEPIWRAVESVRDGKELVILLTPQGRTFTQKLARELSQREHLVIICGRYKGVDERVTSFVDLELSIGDYVLSGGEPAAVVLVDAVVRLLPGAVGDKDSVDTDSFERNLLEAPLYTRPREFMGMKVPEILLSGNHEEIRKWRMKESLKRTLERRPDLLEHAELTEEEKKILEKLKEEEDGPHSCI
ncbi:tRNA (guanosine(37)-N1)-methyltransferase TrmD [bacterium]|nr:MAG: tRNA (guanosine(37)-N1)-methyltransferase TrmD [bacterium]